MIERWVAVLRPIAERDGHAALAGRIDVDVRMLPDYLSGARLPDIEVLARACDGLGVPLDYITRGETGERALPEALAAYLEGAVADMGDAALYAFPHGIDGGRALAFLVDQVRRVATHLNEHEAATRELLDADADDEGSPRGLFPNLEEVLKRAAVPEHLRALADARKVPRFELVAGGGFVFHAPAAPPPPAPALKAGRRRQAR